MGCCGDKTRGGARADIARGQIAGIIYGLAGLPSWTKERYTICAGCEHRTWMTTVERVGWIIDNLGVIVGRTEQIADAATELPVRLAAEAGTFLCCRVCRCVCRKKAATKSAECCRGLWPTEQTRPDSDANIA